MVLLSRRVPECNARKYLVWRSTVWAVRESWPGQGRLGRLVQGRSSTGETTVRVKVKIVSSALIIIGTIRTASTAVTTTNGPKRGGCSWQEANGQTQGRHGNLGTLGRCPGKPGTDKPGSAGISCPPNLLLPFSGKNCNCSAQPTPVPRPGGAPRASGRRQVGKRQLGPTYTAPSNFYLHSMLNY